LSIEAIGEGAQTLPLDETNLVLQAASRVFESVGRWPRRLEARLVNRIPLSRGLGSSSAAIVGGLAAANRLTGNCLKEDALLQLAVDLEGHPDNVAPAFAGGFCVSAMVDGKVESLRFQAPRGLSAVVCIPDQPLATSEARIVLPPTVPFKDAVFTASRVALLVSAFAQRRFDLLGVAMQDVLHQAPRARLLPGLLEAIAAAKEAGAYGAALSGAGSTVIAFVKPGVSRRVGLAMRKVFQTKGLSSHWEALALENRGVRVRPARLRAAPRRAA
jgi:homoserine kinase